MIGKRGMGADQYPPFWCLGKMDPAGLDPHCDCAPTQTGKHQGIFWRHHLYLAPAFGTPHDVSSAHPRDDVNLVPLNCDLGDPRGSLGFHAYTFAWELSCIRMPRKLVQARAKCPQGYNNYFSVISQLS